MSPPKRWLDDDGPNVDDVRSLLLEAEDDDAAIDPPPGAKAAVWAGVAARLPSPAPDAGGDSGVRPAGSTGASGSAAAAASAAGGGLLKSALIGVACGVVLVGIYSVVVPDEEDPIEPAITEAPLPSASVPSRVAPPPLPSAAPPPVISPVAPAEVVSPPASAGPLDVTAKPLPASSTRTVDDARESPSGSSPSAGSGAPLSGAAAAAADRQSRLREESLRLGEARDTLRRGDPAGALARLDDLRSKFPGGVLVQEREALAIEALAKTGRGAEAAARARAFITAYPTSPHATRIEGFLR